ncbi:MAG: cobalamin B12-binding domain-containing protein [Deltaproteobacteria bacterium]|nr:cobalamin B12-binding domain-containing protein [Deltaproteobacteria bacterium]
MAERRIRVLIAKAGLDGHDRGAKIVARALKDAGMEVVYTGIRQTPEQVVNAAIQEGVDVLGMSFLSGDHMVQVPRVMKCLREKGVNDLLVVVGGIILRRHIPALLEMGVDKVFLPGTPPGEIVSYIREKAGMKHRE